MLELKDVANVTENLKDEIDCHEEACENNIEHAEDQRTSNDMTRSLLNLTQLDQ